MNIDREAFAMGYDDGWFDRVMSWQEFTGGNPGYNRSWGSYLRGVEKGKQDRQDRVKEA